MNGSKFKVLLYSDESQPAFFALVYSAILLMNMPNMHLTVVQLKESNDGCIGTENNWMNSWPISLTSDWLKDVIFSKRLVDVSHQVIYCNPSIPDTVEALLEHATKNAIELIVIGTEEKTTLKSLVLGSLGHSLQIKSPIPVLLVKSLPKDFLNSYSPKMTLKVIRK